MEYEVPQFGFRGKEGSEEGRMKMYLAARKAAAAQREEPKTTFFGSAP